MDLYGDFDDLQGNDHHEGSDAGDANDDYYNNDKPREQQDTDQQDTQHQQQEYHDVKDHSPQRSHSENSPYISQSASYTHRHPYHEGNGDNPSVVMEGHVSSQTNFGNEASQQQQFQEQQNIQQQQHRQQQQQQQHQQQSQLPFTDIHQNPESLAVVIAELPWWTSDEDLKHMLSMAGINVDAELTLFNFSDHRVNGKSKGIVYFEFKSLDSARKAKQYFDLNPVEGRKIRANYTVKGPGQSRLYAKDLYDPRGSSYVASTVSHPSPHPDMSFNVVQSQAQYPHPRIPGRSFIPNNGQFRPNQFARPQQQQHPPRGNFHRGNFVRYSAHQNPPFQQPTCGWSHVGDKPLNNDQVPVHTMGKPSPTEAASPLNSSLGKRSSSQDADAVHSDKNDLRRVKSRRSPSCDSGKSAPRSLSREKMSYTSPEQDKVRAQGSPPPLRRQDGSDQTSHFGHDTANSEDRIKNCEVEKMGDSRVKGEMKPRGIESEVGRRGGRGHRSRSRTHESRGDDRHWERDQDLQNHKNREDNRDRHRQNEEKRDVERDRQGDWDRGRDRNRERDRERDRDRFHREGYSERSDPGNRGGMATCLPPEQTHSQPNPQPSRAPLSKSSRQPHPSGDQGQLFHRGRFVGKSSDTRGRATMAYVPPASSSHRR